MQRWTLKNEIIQFIMDDSELYGKVAKALGVSVTSMPRIVSRNSSSLTEYASMEVISKHLNRKFKDLVELKDVKNKVSYGTGENIHSY